jgi:hypothetical protein
MRKAFWFSILSAALATGACKKTQDDTHKASQEVKKSVENVEDQQRDLDKTDRDRGATVNDQNKAQGNLEAAQSDLVAAREKYSITVQDRLAKLDIKLKELEVRTDARARDAMPTIRAERLALGAKIDSMKTQSAAGWKDYTKDVDSSFDAIDKDVNNALK